MWTKGNTGGGGSSVTPSTNGRIKVNGQDIVVYDDAALTTQISNKADQATLDAKADKTQLSAKADIGHRHTAADLNDVDVTNKTDGYVLTYEAASAKTKLKPLPAGNGGPGAASLDGLSDVDTTTNAPKEGDTLLFTGGQWRPSDVFSKAFGARLSWGPAPATRAAMVSFIDDDNKAYFLTNIQPLVETKGIPYGIAVPVNSINDVRGRSMTQAELLHLQNDLGCEIVCHTYTHPNLNLLTTAQLETELGESKKVLMARGYNIRGVAYPFGANNPAVRKVGAKYYDWGVTTAGLTNTYPLKALQVSRVSVGSYYPTGKGTLADYKVYVDEAVANKKWLVVVTHSHDPQHTAEQQQNLSDLIDYIKSLNVPIVNPSVGWEAFGNLVEVEDTLRVTYRGDTFLDNSTEYKTFRDNSRAADALLTDYTYQTITLAEYGNANRGTLPEAGLLETRRVPTTTDFTFSTQTLYSVTGKIYARKPLGYNNATWGAWKTVFNGV